VVVLKGAGTRAFVSGADISEFDSQRANAEQRQRYGEVAAVANRWLATIDKPLVAMIRGYCMGGGLATALAADVRIASSESTFGIPAARLGLGYEYAGVRLLVSLVGPSCAKDLLFSARQFDAAEALRVGLVNRVVEPEAAKAAVNAAVAEPGQRDLDRVARLVDACFDSEDYREGRRAFLEKRAPVFRGR
jgi:enoyl-CoA hydratase/carnithine racemase